MAEGFGRSGSFRLFRLFGIDVFLHWSWFLVALFELQRQKGVGGSLFWGSIEYISLFAIVLMHEFGHSLACRSVGGKADHIMLWPLGGVAFVSPPQRPGAVLWSIAAGPLVNVVLMPITLLLYWNVHGGPEVVRYVEGLFFINLVLLIFNLLPIYPLDGGQILRALLWFFIGPARSLMFASVVGLIGAAGMIVLAVVVASPWIGIIAAFGALQSWVGFKQAQAMNRILSAPRYAGLYCPHCGTPPPAGAFWRCECGQPVDGFANAAACPNCGRPNDANACPTCGRVSPILAWYGRHPAIAPGEQVMPQPYTPPSAHGFDRPA